MTLANTAAATTPSAPAAAPAPGSTPAAPAATPAAQAPAATPSAQPAATTPPASPAAPAVKAPEGTVTPPAPKAPAPEAGKDAKDSKDGKPAVVVPPAEVQYDLKLGEKSLLDKEFDVAEVVKLAKEKGLAPEIAQAILEQREGAIKAFMEDHTEGVKKEIAGWDDGWAKHPVFGGEKLPASNQAVDRFVGKFVRPEVMAELTKTGFIKNPLLREIFASAGQVMADDTFVSGAATAAPQIKDPVLRYQQLEEERMKKG